jgi:hypothetical protein
MRLSAIVPASDSPATLERCLAALRDAERPPDEILVGTSGANAAQARNAAAGQATGDVLLFVDADVLVHRDAIARVRDRLDDDPALTAVFGSYDDAPAAPGAVSGFRNLLHHHVHHAGAGPIASFWAGLGAVRRAAFVEVEGFDGDQRWLEDVEFGARLTWARARIELDPSIQGTHLKALSLRGMLHGDALQRAAPWVRLSLDGRAPHDALNASASHRAGLALSLAGAGALLARRPRMAVAALAGLLVVHRDLYATIARARGPREAALAPGLHALHNIAAAAGAALAVLERLRG